MACLLSSPRCSECSGLPSVCKVYCRRRFISHAALPSCCSEASGPALRGNTAAQAQSAGWAEVAEDAARELRRETPEPEPDTHIQSCCCALPSIRGDSLVG